MTSRLIVLLDILIGASLLVAPVGATFLSTPAVAATRDEDALAAGCDWLERAIAREPERDDSFGMFMRGMRPKCQAMLEGLARKDNSVRADAVQAIVKEIKDLQEVIDAENGGPPPGRNGPTPAEIARQKIADEQAAQDKVAQDKAAEDKAAREKAAEDKAAQERAAQEKAAQEKAAEEAKKAAERDAARQEQTDRKATEEEKRAAAREERERIAAEKKAAEEAKKAAAREERERIAAEKKAAEEARKAAAQEERARVAAEKKAAEEERKAAAEREAAAREEARRKAAELVAEEEASEDAERRATEERARKAAEDRERKAAEERERKAIDEGRQTPARIPSKKGALDGTWEQPEAKVLDRHVKRTLNLLTKDKKVQGELYEEVWFAAPAAWIDASCGGNTTYRMVTTARVSGEVEGDSLVLTREPPRILTCTCSSRCTVETRRRGFDLEIAASGGELRDQTGVFVRPGTAIVTKPGKTEGPEKVLTPRDFAGDWETSPFKQRDRTVVQRVELKVDADGKVTGTFIERSSQGLPLASWKDRFCEGAERWDWVTQWKVEGRVNGRKLALKASDGANLLCTCPTKCVPPKERMAIDLVYGTTGATLTFDDETFERR